MDRRIRSASLLWAVGAVSASWCAAATRDLADLQPVRLTFGQSVVNQLSYDTYRDPFDELQNRPYNLLFTNSARHANLSPWQGQEGSYAHYLNALIGNNGAANVDNDADALQGSWIRRQTDAWAWGLSAAVLTGNDNSRDSNGATAFSNSDELHGIDLRGASAYQLSENSVLGGGLHLTQGGTEVSDQSFEPGVGGFSGGEKFDQLGLTLDGGVRRFTSPTRSWEVQGLLGFGRATQDDFSEDIDANGAVTERFVIRNYELTDLTLGVSGGYNRLRAEGPGETEFRGSLFRTQRDLGNRDLSYSENGTGVTPAVTLLDSQPVATTLLVLSAKTIFAAGETEVFTGAQLAYGMVDGSTTIDATGTIVTEAVDDTRLGLGVTVGVRQSLYRDKLRFIVSGRAEALNGSEGTTFDNSATKTDTRRTVAQYAVGLEGVLANVTFDIAWLQGEEAAVVPVTLGLPSGSRRTLQLDRLVFSAAVSW